MKKYTSLIFALLIHLSFIFAGPLPEGFVYIKDIDPTIQESVRYASSENFVGAPIEGYVAPRTILTRAAAEALHKVQEELLNEGYCLVVYDAYRPQKAVDNFMRWSTDISEQSMKKRYYPRVNKADVFDLGYVAKKSGHSRGSTVDLSIIKIDKKLKNNSEIVVLSRQLNDGFSILCLDDNSVDMGSTFDLFDEASHHDTSLVGASYIKLRNYLRHKMEKYGFKAYSNEWWHYTLVDEPFPNTYFDFDVE